MNKTKHTCEETILPRFLNVWVPCRNTAKVEVDGKWYCGIHDPVKRKEREEAKTKAFWAERALRDRHKFFQEKAFLACQHMSDPLEEVMELRRKAALWDASQAKGEESD